MSSLPKFFEELIAKGTKGEQAMSEVTLQGLVVQARNYLDPVSDEATLMAYKALLRRIAQGELQKVTRKERRTEKPEGMNDDVWRFIISRGPELG